VSLTSVHYGAMICGTAVCALKPLLGREAKRKITWLDFCVCAYLCVWVCVLEYVYRNKAAVGTFCSFAMKSSLLFKARRKFHVMEDSCFCTHSTVLIRRKL
jgi:hypothetical protein